MNGGREFYAGEEKHDINDNAGDVGGFRIDVAPIGFGQQASARTCRIEITRWKLLNGERDARPLFNLQRCMYPQQSISRSILQTGRISCDGLETGASREHQQFLPGRCAAQGELKVAEDEAKDKDAQSAAAKQRKMHSRQISDREKQLDFLKKSLETDLSDIDIVWTRVGGASPLGTTSE